MYVSLSVNPCLSGVIFLFIALSDFIGNWFLVLVDRNSIIIMDTLRLSYVESMLRQRP